MKYTKIQLKIILYETVYIQYLIECYINIALTYQFDHDMST